MLSLLIVLFFMVATLLPNISQAQQSIFDISESSLFSNDNEFLRVDEAFSFNFDQQNNQLRISFDIADGYYLYRHQFRFTNKNARITAVELPRGIDHEDEFFGVQQVYKKQLTLLINIEQADENASLTVRYQGCADKGLCYPPTKQVIELDKVLAQAINNDASAVLSALNTENGSSNNTKTNTEANTTTSTQANQVTRVSEQHQLADMLKQDSLFLTLVAFFIGGLLLSFTPCVFPMYPILTGIIVGAGKDLRKPLTTKKAFTLSFFYVQGMAITYTLLGIVVALAGAQFQAMFQHPVVLIALSILFIFLALSMFGIFNLALPASWQNKLNNISNKQKGGSIFGVVMMGVISGLVASPCTTAPLTGALLYISQTGDVVLGASALYALSLGMGLPLLILGSSGGKLLPKAGAWMNIIKNIFGLLLLAVPIFLLERFIPAIATEALWALLLLATASYFYVENQNSANNQAKGFWFGARSLVIFMMMFVGANMAYQVVTPNQQGVTSMNQSASSTELHFIKVTHLDELNAAVSKANQQGQTVMVDLYADWCVACKEFEKYTFSQSIVQQALANTLLIQIDLTDTGSKDNVALMEHFSVFGLPSILFFDLQGKELSQQRITGFMGAEEFSDHILAIF
ncbi:MAG: protein-disulfide reductase DsbD [Gammaproteobacteria bacterium]|nr:MAG: protein-disulfide reductase DsbD [Gammaproteobacteria bacterium]